MDKQRQELAMQRLYNENRRKNEQDFSDLKKQKNLLEEKRAEMFELKKRMTSYLDSTVGELQRRGAREDVCELEEFGVCFQHEYRKGTHELDREQAELERRGKKLYLQKEENEKQYRQAISDIGKG